MGDYPLPVLIWSEGKSRKLKFKLLKNNNLNKIIPGSVRVIESRELHQRAIVNTIIRLIMHYSVQKALIRLLGGRKPELLNSVVIV